MTAPWDEDDRIGVPTGRAGGVSPLLDAATRGAARPTGATGG
ncbi:MAG: hypothetical protein U0871_16780 [Gemmataceae bacterium]